MALGFAENYLDNGSTIYLELDSFGALKLATITLVFQFLLKQR